MFWLLDKQTSAGNWYRSFPKFTGPNQQHGRCGSLELAACNILFLKRWGGTKKKVGGDWNSVFIYFLKKELSLFSPVSVCAAITSTSNLIYAHKELLAPQKKIKIRRDKGLCGSQLCQDNQITKVQRCSFGDVWQIQKEIYKSINSNCVSVTPRIVQHFNTSVGTGDWNNSMGEKPLKYG